MKKLYLYISLLLIFCGCRSQLYHSVYHSKSKPSALYPNMLQVKSGYIDSSFECMGHYCVGSFYMSQFEITNEQYAYFLNKMRDSSWYQLALMKKYIRLESGNGQIYLNAEEKFVVRKGYEKHPVTNVTSLGGEYYGQWLTAELGPRFTKKKYRSVQPRYRIPSESEWYYAASETGVSHTYSGTHTADELAWYAGNSKSTQTAGQKKPNRMKFYDMSGNVTEWCHIYKPDPDWFGRSYFTGPEPYGARGGSYLSDSIQLRILPCQTTELDSCRNDVGFRITQTALGKPSGYEF